MRRRRKQTKTQRRALATLLLAQKKFLAAAPGAAKSFARTQMKEAAKAAHALDAIKVWEVSE
jgi:hypothetical protein